MEKQEFNDEAKRILNERENASQDNKGGLGKVASIQIQSEPSGSSLIDEIGWIRIKTETLPSQGVFYPQGTDITIRAASSAEIRHWSTIDEEDVLSMDDGLNRLIDKCCRVKFPKMMGSFKDLKEIDRFFLVFAIREFTFKKGENGLNVTFTCKSCGKVEQKSIIKEMLSYYAPSPELQARFSEDEICFHLKLDTGEEIKLYLPTLGVMNYIKQFIKDKMQRKEEYDTAFLKWAPFIFADWRILNDATYQSALQDSYAWSTSKISILDWFIDQMQKTIKAELTHTCSICSAEITAPISFRGGFKSIFLISDISSRLL